MTTDPGWERGPTFWSLTAAAFRVGLVSSHSSCACSVELPARITAVITAKPRQNLRIIPPLCLVAAGQNRLDLSERVYGWTARFGLTRARFLSLPTNRRVTKSKCLLGS